MEQVGITDETPLRRKFPKEYKTWQSIKWRCHCVTARDYHKYGGRGIHVCDRWRSSFQAFFDDVGNAPGKEYSLERVNNGLPYEPGNTRWATVKEQNRNRRNTLFIEFDGNKIYFADFVKELGINYETGRRLLAKGLTAEDFIKRKVSVKE